MVITQRVVAIYYLRNDQYSLRNNNEVGSSQLFRGESQKSRTAATSSTEKKFNLQTLNPYINTFYYVATKFKVCKIWDSLNQGDYGTSILEYDSV